MVAVHTRNNGLPRRRVGQVFTAGSLAVTTCLAFALATVNVGAAPVLAGPEDTQEGAEEEYEASAFLRVAMTAPEMIPRKPREFTPSEFRIYKDTQKQLLRSPFVMLAALRKRECAKLAAVRERDNPEKWLIDQVRVTFPDNGEVMQVSLAGDDPEEAATLLNAVVGAYLIEVVNAERDQKRQRLSELDRIYSEKEVTLRSKRSDVIQLAEQLGVSAPETVGMKQFLAVRELEALQREWAEIKTERRHLQRDLAAQKALRQSDDLIGKLPGAARAKKRAVVEMEVRRLEAMITVTDEQQKDAEENLRRMRKATERFGMSSIDLEMMRADIKRLEKTLDDIAEEREKLKIECRAASRVTLLQRAETPKEPMIPIEPLD